MVSHIEIITIVALDEDISGDHLLAEARVSLVKIFPQMQKQFQVCLHRPTFKVRFVLQFVSLITSSNFSWVLTLPNYKWAKSIKCVFIDEIIRIVLLFQSIRSNLASLLINFARWDSALIAKNILL